MDSCPVYFWRAAGFREALTLVSRKAEPEPFYWLTFVKVLFNDFGNVLGFNALVPNALRINNQ